MPLADQASRHPRCCVMCAFPLHRFYHTRPCWKKRARTLDHVGWLAGTWPFGVVEEVWALVAFRSWMRYRASDQGRIKRARP